MAKLRMPIRSDQVYRDHDADDDHGGAQQHPQSQTFFDEVPGPLAITVQQGSQQKEAPCPRNDREQDKQPKIIAGKPGSDRYDLVGDRGEALEQDDPGAPLRVSGAKGLDLVTIAIKVNQPGADRVVQQRAN